MGTSISPNTLGGGKYVELLDTGWEAKTSTTYTLTKTISEWQTMFDGYDAITISIANGQSTNGTDAKMISRFIPKTELDIFFNTLQTSGTYPEIEVGYGYYNGSLQTLATFKGNANSANAVLTMYALGSSAKTFRVNITGFKFYR